MTEFRNTLGQTIFETKYQLFPGETWAQRSSTIAETICGGYLPVDEVAQIAEYIRTFKFMPGGRYIYYAGRKAAFYNNCYLLRGEEDTREEWAALMQRSASCLMTGGGIGADYSVFRPRGAKLGRTGGQASGPIPLMGAINEIGRRVKQGGSRRSAIYASLNWQHADASEFLKEKDWDHQLIHEGYSVGDAKRDNFDYPAPLDMTNISLNYDDDFLNTVYDTGSLPEVFVENVRQAMKTGEPGFSFNFGDKSNETLRNACAEVTSADDSDVCNLGSLNLANLATAEEVQDVADLATKFLVCGTLRAELPYQRVYSIREKNRRLGLGYMGVHEWLLQRGYSYEMNPELDWILDSVLETARSSARQLCSKLSISHPAAHTSVAPTGTIALLAGTTSGIEPVYATAYRRRFLAGNRWQYTLHVDSVAKQLIDSFDLKPEEIETSSDLADNPEKRIAFQADFQEHIEMAISSTLNLPAWGSEANNESQVMHLANLIAGYAPRLRGLTMYPDGARGGQPLTPVPYESAVWGRGEVHEEANDVCAITGGGSCGV